MKIKFSILIIVCLSIGVFITTLSYTKGQEINVSAAFSKLKSELSPLDLNSTATAQPPAGTDTYLKFYSLEFTDVQHSIGSIKSGKNTLAVQVFQPKDTKATVILSHGYYDHAGVLKHLIGSLVASNYTVLVFDQPGHGLSTGAPAVINDFNEYVTVLNQVTEIAKQSLPQPLHLVGHSMGCAVILDSILKGKEIAGVDKIILMAPLVRSSNWKASGFAMKIAGSRLNSVPRKFRKNSSDKDFIDFHKADPLQAETVPTAWVKAHHRWHDQVHSATATNLIPISILQGDDDGTVDWEYNLEFLKKRVPNAEVIMFKDAGHQLANESHITRSLVLKTILKELSEDTNKG